jgi:Flp pilus assembly pilin Flp
MNTTLLYVLQWLRNKSVAPLEERGAGLVEYTLLVALLALACVAAITALGGETSEAYSGFASQLD